MINFTFYNNTRIIFGKEEQNNIGKLVKEYSSRILLVYGKSSIKKSGLYDQIVKDLNDHEIRCVELNDIKGNPSLTKVYEGIDLCRQNNLNFILAVGGGSVIDTAKAISVGVNYSGDVWNFFIKKDSPTDALPVGCVLTVTGAGSEMSNSCVITKEEENLKRSFDNEIILPKFSILNPEITTTVSKFQSACGSADILSHLFERYFSLVENTDVIDRMIESIIQSVIINTEKVLQSPLNYDYRAELMWASTLAQNGLLSTGRIGDWGCHAIEHELSGEFDIPHGLGLAMITCSWMKSAYLQRPEKFTQLFSRVFEIDESILSDKELFDYGIKQLQDFYSRIGLEFTTESLNLTDSDIERLAKRAVKHSKTRGRFLVMGEQEIIDILTISKSP